LTLSFELKKVTNRTGTIFIHTPVKRLALRCHGHRQAKATVEYFGGDGSFREVYQHPVIDGLGAGIAIDRLRLLIGIVVARSGWHGWLQAND
jgi:hypothetical protein